MGTISTGINKSLAYKKESTWGTLAGASDAKLLRRVTGSFSLTKDTYQSDEIRTDYQMQDYRHGVRKAEGSLNGELSAGSYSDFFAAAVAKDFVAGVTTGAVIVIGVNASTPAITRSSGSFLTDGFKVGDVIRGTGFTNTSNNSRNLLVLSVVALSMTVKVLDGGTLTTEAAGASVTVSVYGKKTLAPTTGHTDDSFTFEEWFPDNTISEVYTGNKVNTIGVQLPATGLTTVDFAFMGKDLEQTGASQYFTSPTALSTSGIFASVNGAVVVNGVAVALITSMSFNINRNLTSEAVVGSNVVPDIFEGRILCDGEFSAFLQDGTFRDLFDNETEASITVVLTSSNAFDADFMAFTFPRVKINSATKNDGETGITTSHSFQALRNSVSGSKDVTTIAIQDSAA